MTPAPGTVKLTKQLAEDQGRKPQRHSQRKYLCYQADYIAFTLKMHLHEDTGCFRNTTDVKYAFQKSHSEINGSVYFIFKSPSAESLKFNRNGNGIESEYLLLSHWYQGILASLPVCRTYVTESHDFAVPPPPEHFQGGQAGQ